MVAQRTICSIIMPRQEAAFPVQLQSKKFFPCVLPVAHQQDGHPHIFRLPDGTCIAWETDYECDCCDGLEPDECITYWEVPEALIEDIKKGRP